jgi:HTH-type transcriptional regulator/antitoxin HigA
LPEAVNQEAIAIITSLQPVRSERDYDNAVAALSQLLDTGAANEQHPLANLAHTLGTLIAEYDATHYPVTVVSSTDMAQFLMDQHRLLQSDLPEIGS